MMDPITVAVAAVLDHDHLSDQQVGTQYKVQLVDEEGEGIEDCVKIVRRGVLRLVSMFIVIICVTDLYIYIVFVLCSLRYSSEGSDLIIFLN